MSHEPTASEQTPTADIPVVSAAEASMSGVQDAQRPGLRRVVTSRPFIFGAAGVVVAGAVAASIAVALQPSAIERAGEACSGVASLAQFTDDEGEPIFSEEPSDTVAGYFEGNIRVEDGGNTLIVQTQSTDDDPLAMSTLTLDCVYEQLEVPVWLQENISATRALDGRQSEDWDGFSAQWGYHPDDGMNMVITAR